jgi:prevent-host-death family protein
MISAGIKELKNNLSRYLSQVKNGEDILITERGKAIARILPVLSGKTRRKYTFAKSLAL